MGQHRLWVKSTVFRPWQSPGTVGMSQRRQFRPHAPQQTASLFDHYVGAGEQRRWHVNSERLGSLHIDDQFEMGWLFDW
jgi:hypothetical protein